MSASNPQDFGWDSIQNLDIKEFPIERSKSERDLRNIAFKRRNVYKHDRLESWPLIANSKEKKALHELAQYIVSSVHIYTKIFH